ncbi:uncharacterized protein LOC134855389 [Symsagittifera roscoffensis]|uniref:uncharacterized protein LOC134855389 n=1 Tax=Symsagittifera roscoffensis TaxID=84072 RepID=UPI00307B2C52
MEQCGFCPTKQLDKLCQMPFEHNGQNYNSCAPISNKDSLQCKDRNGTVWDCYYDDENNFCKPPSPDFGPIFFQTLVAGESARLFWDASSSLYNNFDVFINEDHIAVVEQTEYNATNLTAGLEYKVQVYMNSFHRRSGPQTLVFNMTNSDENLAATNITSSSATLIFDIKERNDFENSSQTCSISHLELDTRIEDADFIRMFLTPAEIESGKSTKIVDSSNNINVGQLNSGFIFCFEVSPINTCTNMSMENRTLFSCAPIVPQPLNELTSNLTFVANNEQTTEGKSGIGINASLSQLTAAEFIHMIVTCTVPNVTVIDDGGFKIMIKEVESVVMNKTVSECRTSNCAFKSEESDAIWFTSEVLPSENQESGLRCDVEIFTRTDFSESDHTVISHFEAPNPVEMLTIYSVEENSLRINWLPPANGFFDHFFIEIASKGDLISSQKIDGYLRYVASDLVPGTEYTISVFAVSDPQGQVRSKDASITQDSAPAAPQNLIIDHLSDLQSIDVNFDYSESAEIKGFQIQVHELDEEGDPNYSSENILEDSSISLPIHLNPDVQTYRLKLAKFASAYKIIVRSESINGQISIRFASQNIITGLPQREIALTELSRSEDSLCFLWETVNGTNRGIVNKLRTVLVQDNSFLRQSESSSVSIESTEHGFGLKCIQYVRNYTQDRLTVQLHFWREHTATSLKTTASINQFSIAPQEEINFNLDIKMNCQTNSCILTIMAEPFQQLKKLDFKCKIFESEVLDGKNLVQQIELEGSNCETELDSCTYTLSDLTPDTHYNFEMKPSLFGKEMPHIFNEQFHTKKADEGNVLVIIIIVVASITLLILVVVATAYLLHYMRSNKKPRDEAKTDQPTHSTYDNIYFDNQPNLYEEPTANYDEAVCLETSFNNRQEEGEEKEGKNGEEKEGNEEESVEGEKEEEKEVKED